jgi:hypothetical protein
MRMQQYTRLHCEALLREQMRLLQLHSKFHAVGPAARLNVIRIIMKEERMFLLSDNVVSIQCNVVYRFDARAARVQELHAKTRTPNFARTSTRHNSITMEVIDKVIEDLESQESGPQYPYQKYATKWGVDRSTLSRRHRGVSRSMTAGHDTLKNLNTIQQQELVQHIRRLTEQGLPPTREMIRNFGSAIAIKPVSKSWVTRFINENHVHLISRWSTDMDHTRHRADSGLKYKQYFDALFDRINYYKILPSNTYNMDEKGFMIGVINKGKRVFEKSVFERGGMKQFTQDGNREWTTILATICADGTWVAPSAIFAAKRGNIREHWVKDLQPEEHYGVAWVKDVFNRYTQEKARRGWRLLILDGHGSHVTLQFIEFCTENKIILAVFPAHSTHTLQPRDVGMLGPLSTAYSSQLVRHQQQAQGSLPIRKGDFISPFWPAFTSTFTKKNIKSSFKATGIWPMDSSVITKKFEPSTPPNQTTQEASGRPSPATWRHMGRLVERTATESSPGTAQKLTSSFHRLSTLNKLQEEEIRGLKASLGIKNKRTKRGNPLPLPLLNQNAGGAALYSPHSVRVAKETLDETRRVQHQEELEKAETKRLQEAAKLLKEKQQKKAAEKRKRDKKKRDKEKAKKACERAKKKAESDKAKALQLSQKGKNKVTKAQAVKPKKKQPVRPRGRPTGAVGVQEVPSAVQTRTTRVGRSTTVPLKFR